MRMRIVLATTIASMAVSMTAQAHEGHDKEEKAIPTTCAQLADTKRYTNDVAYPQVKALKARCDAEKKEKDKTSPPKPSAKNS